MTSQVDRMSSKLAPWNGSRLGQNDIDWGQVGQEYRAGATYKDLSVRLGVPVTTLIRWMRNNGIESLGRRDTRRNRSEKRRQLAADLHAQGRTSTEIAEVVGCTPVWVRQVLGINGWEETYADRNQQVLNLYRAGNTIQQIAASTGIHNTQVGRIVQRAGLSRPRGPRPKSAEA